MLQQIYEEACNTSTWSDPNPERCCCRGGGWFLSDVDTWHKCPHHFDGQPNGEGSEEDWERYEAKKAGKLIEDYEPKEVEAEDVMMAELDEIPF